MMNNKIKIVSVFLIITILFISLVPVMSFAVGQIDVDRNATLNILFKDDSKLISDADFSIYKVADMDKDGRMKLTDDFSVYINTVSGLNDLNHLDESQWLTIASTLKAYVQIDNITPIASGKTDSNGNLTISGLKVGLYLVFGTPPVKSGLYTYYTVPFMVFLPSENTENNSWDYNVTAIPKYTKEFIPPITHIDHITRKVLKKWDDTGYESLRPTEVIVQLLKNGEVYDTQTLNKVNNWRYAWDDLDADYDWEVIEKSIEGYTVSVTRSGITFTITNKYTAPVIDTDIPVQKRIIGDTPPSESIFTFILTAGDEAFPMPADSTGTFKEITITGAGSRAFGEIDFTKPGIYVYTVKEINNGIEGYTYDDTVYTLTYEVTENDGKLSVTESIKNDNGDAVSAIEFTNDYKIPGNKIPQTGILWWPVPVLLFVGCAFIIIGIINRRRPD